MRYHRTREKIASTEQTFFSYLENMQKLLKIFFILL